MMKSAEQSVEWELAGETEILWKKPAPVPLCPPQISYDQTWARTRAAAVVSRRLTAWAVVWPYFWKSVGNVRTITCLFVHSYTSHFIQIMVQLKYITCSFALAEFVNEQNDYKRFGEDPES
jgi:hypothetical protein